MPYHVFLSHSSADKPAVEALARRLAKEGIDPWLDKWHLIPGDPWQPAIEGALAESATCAVFVGPSGFGPWQNEEMRAAIDRRVRDSGRHFRVIPVLLPGAERAERSSLPTFLATTTWVEFRDSLEDLDAFHRLVCGIRGLEPGTGPGQAVYEGQCPYRGLRVFDVDDAAFFFGREALVEWLLNELRPATSDKPVNRFLAVVGASGSGKSSLARAGLVAALKHDGVPSSSRWPIAISRPGSDPLENLAVALSKAADIGQGASALADLIAAFAKSEKTLHLTVRRLLPENASDTRVVVVVDQFEEIFTLCRKCELRDAFVRNLLYAAKSAEGQTLVILAMRADFYAKCAANAELAAAMSDHHVLVGPMTEDELRRAIERPVQRVGCEFDAGLVDLLVREVRNQPGALPLLQDALLELWKQREGRRLTVKAYQEIGKLEGALQRRADATLQTFSKDEQELCRLTFLRLTQPGEGTEDTKRRVSMRELQSLSGNSAATEAIIQKLTDKSLLTTEGDLSHKDACVEVAHEALIRNWPQLRKWIDADRAGLRVRARLTEAAREWKNSGHDPAYLYSGARLAVAEEWAVSHPGELTIDEAEFVRCSREAQKQRETTELEAARTLAEALRERAEEAEKRAKEEKVSAELRGRLEQEARKRQEREIEATRTVAEEQKRRAELSEQREQEQKEAASKLQQAALKQRRRAVAAAVAASAALILLALSVVEIYREKVAATQAKQSEIAANGARDAADDLISAMLFRLRGRLEPIGRLDLLDEVGDAANEYLDQLPMHEMTDSRFRMRSVTLGIKGDVLRAQGKLPEALAAYQQGLAIAKRLADQDPSNAGWQRDLATAYDRMGDVLRTQGRLPEGLAAYQQGLAITKRLADQDPSNAGWQQDLAAAYDRMGDVRRAEGSFPEALDTYQQGLNIRQKLADQNRSKADWQRDLSVSYDRVGDILRAQGKLPEALAAYQQGLAIAKRLADQDPSNAGWQRDLSLSYGRTGQAFRTQGKLPEALAAYQEGLAIAKRLADQDPSNADWRRDLSVAYDKVADILVAQGNLPEALTAYQQGLAIAKRLADQDPSNAGWQRDLIVVYYRIGICAAQMDGEDSSGQATNFLHTGQELAKSYPGREKQDLINAFSEALKLLNH
jgi:tetratricopeptide (TPR) repeat protein